MSKSFSSEFFVNNRKRLCAALPGHVLVIAAHSLLQYSVDEPYSFRQDSNFWYLSGIDEPDMYLYIDTDTEKSVLLLPEQNEYQREWDGKHNEKLLKEMSGVDEISFKSALNQLLKDALKASTKIGYLAPPPDRIEPYGFYSNPSRKLLYNMLLKSCSNDDMKDVRLDIARLRSIKQPVEIEEIQEAIDVTGTVLAHIKSNLKSYENEKDIERELTIEYTKKSDGHKFDPIVASGRNAATIHYKKNNQTLDQDALILLDTGAKVGMYGADISRTWAVGRPTTRQKDIYHAVLKVHERALARLRPGVFLKDMQEEVNKDLKAACKKLQLPEVELPTGLSHFLGIDTHDAGDYKSPLEPGMIITVEPGMYVPEENIGVRIEDVVLLTTKQGIKNLSSHIPKTL